MIRLSSSRSFVVCGLLLLVLPGLAQVRLEPAEVEALQAAATAQFLQGEITAGEALLQQSLSAAEGTASRELMLANRLLGQALNLRSTGHMQIAVQLGVRVGDRLDAAEKLATPEQTALRANIEELRGLLAERLTGDSEQALAHYRSAVALSPDAESAKVKLELADTQRVAVEARSNPEEKQK